MARAKDLAGLAALAGLGYMLSKKGDKAGADTGGDSNPTRAARPVSTETRPEAEAPRRQITGYMAKAPLDDTDKYPSGVMGGARMADDVKPTPVKPSNVVPGNDLPPAKLKSVSTPSDKSIKLAPENRDLEAGMSRGTRTVPNDNYSNEGRSSAKPPSTVSSTEEGMKNYKPRRPPVASSTEEGMKNYKPRRTPAQQLYKPPTLMKKGGMTSSASSRADGIATKGKTRGKIC